MVAGYYNLPGDTGYTNSTQQARIRTVVVRGELITIVDTTTTTTDTCPSPWCHGTYVCNCRSYSDVYREHQEHKREQDLKKS